MERRQAERFPVHLRCFLTYSALKGAHIAGCVENLSRSGVLVSCEDIPVGLSVGDDCEISIALPVLRPYSVRRALRCLARVARISPEPHAHYVAASISDMQFCDLPVSLNAAMSAHRLDRMELV